jgi:hypothetical protein
MYIVLLYVTYTHSNFNLDAILKTQRRHFFIYIAWMVLSVLNRYDERIRILYKNRLSSGARVCTSYITLLFMRYFLNTYFHQLLCTYKIGNIIKHIKTQTLCLVYKG